MEDEIPLIQRNELKSRSGAKIGRDEPKSVIPPKIEQITHQVQIDDSLQSLSLKYGCTPAEIKQLNNLFSDVDLHTCTAISIPDRKVIAVGKLIDIPTPTTSIETTKNDSETSSTGDADAATRALLERIDLSNKDLVSKVSSIGSTQEPSEEELLLENEHKLSEFLGNMPPIVDLKNMQRFQRENEYRQWIGLGLCVVVTLIGFPLLMYYYATHHQGSLIP